MKARGKLVATVTDKLPSLSRFGRLRRWCRRHRLGLRLEAWYPRLLAIVAGVVIWRTDLSEAHVGTLIADILPIAVTLATVLAGFQATAQSVLVALIDSAAWKYLQRIEHDQRLVDYHWESILSLLLFITLSLAVLIAKAVSVQVASFTSLLPAAFGGLLIHSGLCCFRIMRLMVYLLKHKDAG